MNYAVVDIETTGGYAAANAITEISIFVHNGEKIINSYTSLVNPYRLIPRHITALTGITQEMVDAAPGFEEIASEVYEILKGCVFVAHSVNFDYSFIKHQLNEFGHTLNVPRLCTIRLSRKLLPDLPSYSLGNLCRSLSIPIEQRHRAEGDAKATAILFDKLIKLPAGEAVIQDMLRRTSREQWIPQQLSEEALNKLPAMPGVYYFLNEKKKVIYVGKALNIRKRVAGHFMPNNPELKRQQFLRQVADINFEVCLNEFHALILESIEIRRLWPRYNYAQKQPAKRYGLYCFEDNLGYLRLCLDVQRKNLPALYSCNLLTEGQTMLRKLMEEFNLHPQLCYLDKAPLTEQDIETLPEQAIYNTSARQAIEALKTRLKTIVLLDTDHKAADLCIYMERGVFWGMQMIAKGSFKQDIEWIKQELSPCYDNDFIRMAVHRFAERYPEKCIPIP